MEVLVVSANRVRRLAVAVLVAVPIALAAPLPNSAPAAADELVTLGGGAGIVVDGETYCTLTSIGTDKTGALVGFTSAHCGGPGRRCPPSRTRTAV